MRKFNVMENSHISKDKDNPIYQLVDVIVRDYYPTDLAADFHIDEITDRNPMLVIMSCEELVVNVTSKKGGMSCSFKIFNLMRDSQNYYLESVDDTKLVFSRHAFKVTIE